ncbi:hypothetical protein OG689_42900 [Kitasatospora sp. NBC_00240]|nr:hypothetical protein [Kitasatospora sp. NBC_00240]MCX5215894.1 hypothetical protein [Kitasatospora sp. NBC_00240]
MGEPGPVDAEQDLLAVLPRQLLDRGLKDGDVVAGVVGPGVAGPQVLGEQLAGVVAVRGQGAVPEHALLVRAGRALLLGRGGNDGGIRVDHGPALKGPAVHGGPGKDLVTGGEVSPDPATHHGARPSNPVQFPLLHLAERPGDGGHRGGGADHLPLVLQQTDVAHTARAEHDRAGQVGQHLTTRMPGREALAGHRRRQRPGQPHPLGEQLQMHASGVTDLPPAVCGHGQTLELFATLLHGKGAPHPTTILFSTSRIIAGRTAPFPFGSHPVSTPGTHGETLRLDLRLASAPRRRLVFAPQLLRRRSQPGHGSEVSPVQGWGHHVETVVGKRNQLPLAHVLSSYRKEICVRPIRSYNESPKIPICSIIANQIEVGTEVSVHIIGI